MREKLSSMVKLGAVLFVLVQLAALVEWASNEGAI
jgi:hypothetical protein